MLPSTMELSVIVQTVYSCLPYPSNSDAANLSAVVDSSSSDVEDRISALPANILRNVVSRLPVKDAARTAVLSPRWRGVWRSTPLVLDDPDLPEGCPVDWSRRVADVTRVLASHPGPFRFVHLFKSFMAREKDALAEWLRLLADKGVENLTLVNRPWPLDVPLPASILRCSLLRCLYLGMWRFPDTTGFPRGPNVFPHLQELGICHTIMAVRDLEHVIACSPDLKIFALIANHFSPPRVRIGSHSLRCVLLWVSKVQEFAVVAAPRLERLILNSSGTERTKIKIGYAPALTVLGHLETGTHVLEIGNTIIKAGETNVSPNATVPSIKVLSLKVRFEVVQEVKMLFSFLKCFPQVETLHITAVFNIDGDGSPVKSINYSTFWEEFGQIKCVESHVRRLILHHFTMEKNELGFIKSLLMKAEKLERVLVVLSGDHSTARLTRLLDGTTCVSKECGMLILEPVGAAAWSYQRASDLSLSDPFPSYSQLAPGVGSYVVIN